MVHAPPENACSRTTAMSAETSIRVVARPNKRQNELIVYQYRKGRLVPVPVPDPEPATERRWKFELQPLTPQQKQMVTTLTVGGILLMIATMILLAPVGA